MENILLVLNIILAFVLVLLVLMQKSEGGALGIGVSQESFMFSRSAGNFMTKATAVVATLFIICSLGLTIVSRGDLAPTSSVLDTIAPVHAHSASIAASVDGSTRCSSSNCKRSSVALRKLSQRVRNPSKCPSANGGKPDSTALPSHF